MLLAILSIASVSGAQESTVRVILQVGEVLGPGGEPVKYGTVLGPGDTIETGSGASAVLEFSDGSQLEIGEKTKFDLAVLTQDANTGARTSRIKLLWGRVKGFLSREEEQSFEIEAPYIQAGVQFSEPTFEVFYDVTVEKTIIYSSTVELRVTHLPTGETMTITRGTTVVADIKTVTKVKGILRSPYQTIPEYYHLLGAQMYEEKRYEETITTYTILIEEFSSTTYASKTKARMPEYHMVWATSLQEQKQYTRAIEIYQRVVTVYSQSTYVSQAQASIVDCEVAVIGGGKPGKLPPPVAASRRGSGNPTIKIKNDTPYTLTMLLSGPTSKRLVIKSGGTKSLELGAGWYNVAVKADNPNINPFSGRYNLESGGQYTSRFYVGR